MESDSGSNPSERPGKAYQDLVAAMAKAFDPSAGVSAGVWISGPDGRLDMDVSIRGTVDGKPMHIVIECKDFDPKKTGKVGRSFIDALDSKRHDLGVDAAFICSNAGFTQDALSKAGRKGIGAISVLSEGDSRVKVVIEKEIYFRKAKVEQVQFQYTGKEVSEFFKGKDVQTHDLKYQGKSVDAWLQDKAMIIITSDPAVASRIFSLSFRFKKPTEFDFKSQPIVLDRITISLCPTIEWFAQTIELDAMLGLYDYLRQRVRIGTGDNKYILKNFNPDIGVQLDTAPDTKVTSDQLLPGEVDVALLVVDGFKAPPAGIIAADLDPIVVPEDLALSI